MIDALIRWSLHNKLIVLALAAILLVWGGWQAVRLPVDVLPDLTAPTVTILVEGHGIAPEEMERALAPKMAAEITAAIKPLGFRWVSLDLEGYRMGSLNEVLFIRSSD